MSQQPGRLELFSGWKEIANYFGKGVRTVQRYERELGLPVRRPAGKTCGSVMATRVELDAWIAARPVRGAFQLTRGGDQTLLKQFRFNMRQMHQLRLECHDLREELFRSLELLHQNLRAARPQDFPSNSRVADGLIFDPKKKAN